MTYTNIAKRLFELIDKIRKTLKERGVGRADKMSVYLLLRMLNAENPEEKALIDAFSATISQAYALVKDSINPDTSTETTEEVSENA